MVLTSFQKTVIDAMILMTVSHHVLRDELITNFIMLFNMNGINSGKNTSFS